jgi:hypothetical protein
VLLPDAGSVALSADDRSVVTLGHHELRRWTLDMRELVAIAQRVVQREFTAVERQRYFP